MINLIPMAGKGNRFFQELYNVPKPFIPIMGTPMFITVLKSFPKADRYLFICQKEHVARYRLETLMANHFGNAEIILTETVTEGPACSCLLAEDRFDPKEGLYIASCDYQMIFDQKKYEELLSDESVDVIIWTFKIGHIKKANPKGFAYCKTDGDRVVEVVEKNTISDTPQDDHAVVGSFTYRRSELFVEGAKSMIEKDIRVNNEFYVATSINQLIGSGYKVVYFEIDKFISFGNPFELLLVQYWQDYFDQLEDHPYLMSQVQKRVAV